MASKRKLSGSGLSMPAGIGIGVIAAVAVMLIGALIMAFLVIKETVGIERIGIFTAIILLLASAVGAWLASWISKKKKLLVCGLTALAFYLILLSITAVFFDGMFRAMGLTALMILIGAGMPLLTELRKKSPKSKIKIPAYR